MAASAVRRRIAAYRQAHSDRISAGLTNGRCLRLRSGGDVGQQWLLPMDGRGMNRCACRRSFGPMSTSCIRPLP